MTGTVCLQGGGEFSPGCRPMDAELVRRAGGRVVVTALAGAVGRDYRTATENGVRHYREIAAGQIAAGVAGSVDVVGAPDVREDPAGALAVLKTARLLVLPGGSPSRLLAAVTGSAVGQLVADLLADGGVVMGASAGAMVLCSVTVLPDRRGPHGPAVTRGLDLVGDLVVVPHWSWKSSRSDWLRAVAVEAPHLTILGIPEESGVLVVEGVLTAVGRAPTTLWGGRLVGDPRDLAPGESWERA